jgi:hypothetical protein
MAGFGRCREGGRCGEALDHDGIWARGRAGHGGLCGRFPSALGGGRCGRAVRHGRRRAAGFAAGVRIGWQACVRAFHGGRRDGARACGSRRDSRARACDTAWTTSSGGIRGAVAAGVRAVRAGVVYTIPLIVSRDLE